MYASRILRRSFCHYIAGKHNSLQSFSAIQENYSLTLNPQKCLHQSCRTLILEPTSSQFVKLNRLSDLDSGIVEVSLDRPETKNAIGKDLLRGFKNALEEISTDSSAHVMLIRSSVPKVFCAGADLKERKRQSASEVQSFVNSLRSTFSFLEALCIPTIAVIEGAALGGGLEMALSCDLRICGEEAVLGLPETGLAIIPGPDHPFPQTCRSQGGWDTAAS